MESFPMPMIGPREPAFRSYKAGGWMRKEGCGSIDLSADSEARSPNTSRGSGGRVGFSLAPGHRPRRETVNGCTGCLSGVGMVQHS
jgi:hypothetical protein